ncbi:MAG: hypothetical protein GOMPHAMPRED_005726 [Gomphillus americanus]|uniref:OTU domain-containing protein n=1 Tax=Gomphillus americanus TaxID=1940652 RepID=A0A8H3FU22_9LECA|nr:MAG: hypothetical protein GOMPHAMPRED_005726 [Gomphillus americanus]
MEELQRRHRLEQKDLQARVTQKKKNASKKTRKGVNEECEEMERQLKARQGLELAALDGNTVSNTEEEEVICEQPMQIRDPEPTNVPISNEQETSSDKPQERTKKKNRQRERLARRAAEQEQAAANAAIESSEQVDYRAKEREIIDKELNARRLIEKEVRSDGHCLYAAMADQLKQNDIVIDSNLPDYKVVRQDAASFIAEHPDDFAPFLEEAVDEYVIKVRDTAEWGGQVELLALARVYGITINVLQGDGRVETVEPENTSNKVAWLAYYRHSFGLGEHYNSLRVKP